MKIFQNEILKSNHFNKIQNEGRVSINRQIKIKETSQ